ncbi:MAG: flagellar basal body P-ring formation protein FlgA [Spartobacteria bacterium]|nr:flagellar basal body P-ring formation protein FlgA [Spartobacteria bacterium]
MMSSTKHENIHRSAGCGVVSHLRRLRVMLVFWFAFCGVAAAFADGSFISIRDVVSVSGPDILLEDIARSPTLLPEGWGERTVLKSPSPGDSEEYELTTVAYALQRYPDMKDVTLSGQLQFRVSRKAVQVSPEMIQEAVTQFVEDNPTWQSQRYQLEFLPFSDRVMVSEGELDIHVENFTENSITEAMDFDVAIWVNGMPERMLSVPVMMTQMQEVWVAAGDFDRGHRLTLDDLNVAYVPTGGRNKNCTPVSESITGMELTRRIKEGKPIIKYLVRPPVCAERGEDINVHMVRSGLSVTLRAKALGKGRVGDRILCLNEQSKRRVLVRLVSDRAGIIEN